MTDLPTLLSRATPGPWSVDPDTRDGMEWNRHIVDYDFNRVCFMAHSGGNSPSTDEANAALIALAPQLAAALIEAMEALQILATREFPACATLTRIDAIMKPGGDALKGD